MTTSFCVEIAVWKTIGAYFQVSFVASSWSTTVLLSLVECCLVNGPRTRAKMDIVYPIAETVQIERCQRDDDVRALNPRQKTAACR